MATRRMSALGGGGNGTISGDMALINRILQVRDILERATTFDSWGQVLEADVEYKKMIGEIGKLTKSGEPTPFYEAQVKFLDSVAAAGYMRSMAAQDLSGEHGIQLEQIMQLIPMIEPIMCNDEPRVPTEFPIKEVTQQARNLDSVFGILLNGPALPSATTKQQKYNYSRPAQAASADEPEDDEDDNDDETAGQAGADTATKKESKGKKAVAASGASGDGGVSFQSSTGGTLLPFTRFPGQTNISITILKIRLKDPQQYIEPIITVSIKDPLGQTLRSVGPQDTPFASKIDDEFVYFNKVVHLQLPMEALEAADATIFLEFKHFKMKKHKQSVKCWSMLEMDELNAVNGVEMPLEIYQKPTDFKKKKVALLTEKAHYLYVHITRTTD